MLRVYRNNGNIEEYNNSKETLDLATTDIRKSKRSFVQKLANYIKMIARLSKQKVRDKVGPLENSACNIGESE